MSVSLFHQVSRNWKKRLTRFLRYRSDHGTFDEALLPKISVPVIRAIQIADSDSQVKSQADYLLFDAPIAGSGQTFDWQLLADKQIEQDYFIAGGLTVDNVQRPRKLSSPMP